MFAHVRKTNLTTFVVVILFMVAFPFFAFYVYYPSGWEWQETLLLETGRLIEPDLVLNLAAACLVTLYVWVFGRLRPRDLGLTSSLPEPCFLPRCYGR